MASDIAQQHQMCRQETHLELQLLGRGTVGKGDTISSPRNLSALGSLYHSVTWFTSALDDLKSSPEGALSPTTPRQLEPISAATPYTPYLPLMPQILPNEQLKLPLSQAMALRFQALLKTYEQLAELILHTIRIDIRCRTIHYLDAAMRHGNYCIDHEAGEPDPHVIDLNAELGQCDDFISTTLPKKEQQFVFVGLGHLMEHLLISNARHLRQANVFGVKKIMRNVLALQQSIKTITNEQKHTEFERAKRYYSLFFMSPPDMLDSIREKQLFSFDEYKTVLDLQCGVNPRQGEAGPAQATDRNYSMYVIDLHGLELESSEDS
jgi:exocyst complex component 4